MAYVWQNRVSLYYLTALAATLYLYRLGGPRLSIPPELLIAILFSGLGPLLYLQKNWSVLSRAKLKHALRFVALLLSSVAVIRFVLPEADRQLWTMIKPVLLPVLALEYGILLVVETAVFLFVVRIAASDAAVDDAAATIEGRTALPRPIARQIALEVKFWQRLLRRFRHWK